ncbi:MAG: hypothetical protein C0430_03615 [Flavobacterium sp.]|nr:hypothetical protein [Flavobacterium sp.]
MTKNDYKYASISLLLINIWTSYVFFGYYTNAEMLRGFGLLSFFIFSVYFAIGMGIILFISRFLYFKKDKKNKLINNFFYVFTGIFNINLFIIWIVTSILQMLSLDYDTIFFPILNLLISTLIFIDIYKFRKINNRELK